MHDKADGIALSRGGLIALLACGLFTTIGLFSPGLLLPQIERAFSDTLAGIFTVFGVVMLATGGIIALRAGITRRSTVPM